MIFSLDEFFRSDYMPHGHCYLWNKQILWVNVISDVLIAIAYFSIPIALYYFVKKRQDLEFKGVFILFSLFIALCGITHLIGIIVIWHGTYGILGVAKALTAIVSVVTAIQVIRIAPAAIKIPSPSDLRKAMELANQEQIKRIELQNQIAQERVLRESTEAVYVGVLVTDEAGKIVIANDAVCSIFGYEKKELEGSTINKLVDKNIESHHQDLIDRFVASPDQQRHMASGRIVTGVAKDGREIPVEIVLNRNVQYDESYIFVSVLDLSERVSHQQKLLETNTRFERIISSADEALWELNLRSGELWISTKLSELLEHPDTNFTFDKHNWLSSIKQEFRDIVEDFFFGEDVTDGIKLVEFQAKTFSGEYKWFVAKAGHTFDLNKTPLFRSGTIYLIQQRKMLEHELSDQHNYFRSIFEGAGNAIFSILIENNGTFRLENINRVAEDTMGLPWNKTKGKLIDELVPDLISTDIAESMKGNYAKVVENKAPHEYIEPIPGNNQELWWKTKLYPQQDEEGNIIRIVGSASDITELIETQKQLEAKEQFITRALNASLTGVYIYNKNTGQNEFINESYTRITGYTLDQLNAMTEAEFMDCFHQDDLSAVINHMNNLFSTDTQNTVEQLEYRFKRSDGQWIWCLSQDTVFDFDENGQVISFLGSFLDITAMKEMQFNLIELKNEAEEASTAKSEFLANMSHEIRTPMNAILGLIQMLLQMHLGEKQKLFIEKIHTSSKYLLNVLNDVLDYSKIEAGKLDITNEAFSIYKLISETVGLFALSAEEKGIEISYDISRLEHKYYSGDPLRIGQVLNNLVGNSIKFTEKGGVTISVSSEETDDCSYLVFCVEDTGIGISKEHIDKLFKSFTQADTSITRKYGGTGLGLSIIKGILNQMQGVIEIESEPMKGSKFTVRIPSTPYNEEDQQNGDLENELKSTESKPKSLLGVTILVVEDNKTNQLLATEFLKSQGASVVVAENGEQAVELCRENWFDIILMDLQMPKMNGFEATNEIRKHSVRNDVPIIAMSAAVSDKDIDRVYAAKMNGHIPKPIDLKFALKIIRQWVTKNSYTKDEPIEKQNTNTPPPLEWDTNILDVPSALEKLNNQTHLYIILAKSYLSDQGAVANETLNAFSSGDFQGLERIAHTIKSLAGSLGAKELYNIASDLETKAFEQTVDLTNIETFIKKEIEAKKLFRSAVLKLEAASNHTQHTTQNNSAHSLVTNILTSLKAGHFISDEDISNLSTSLEGKISDDKLIALTDALRALDYSLAIKMLNRLPIDD